MEIKIVIDDRLVGAWRRVRQLATGRHLAVLAATTVLGSAVFAVAAPITKPNEFAAGTPIVAAEVNANFDALYTAFNDRVIREDRTISLTTAEGCSGLMAELEELDDFRIGSTAIVTIELAPGTYDCPETLEISHPNANRLVLIGLGAAPADVTLSFPAGQNGILLEYGTTLRRLENLTLDGQGTGDGLYVARSSHVSIASVVIKEFSRGLYVLYGSSAVASGLTTTDNTSHGVRVATGSSASINGVSQNNGGSGYNVEYGSVLTTSSPDSINNGLYGFEAVNGSYVRYTGATLTGNTSGATNLTADAFNTADGSLIDAD